METNALIPDERIEKRGLEGVIRPLTRKSGRFLFLQVKLDFAHVKALTIHFKQA